VVPTRTMLMRRLLMVALIVEQKRL